MSGLSSIAATLLAVVGAQLGSSPFTECDTAFEAGVGGKDGPACYWDVAEEQGLHEQAAQRLDELLTAHPHLTWLRFYLANTLMVQMDVAAEEHYRRAAAEFIEQQDHPGGVHSQLNLAKFLGWLGRSDEVSAELDRAREMADVAGDAELQSLVAVQQADYVAREGGDLEPIELQLRTLYEQLDEDTSYLLHRRILFALSNVTYELGHHLEARRLDNELIELTVTNDNPYNEASARGNRAAHVSAGQRHGTGTERVIKLYESALQTAVAGGNRSIEAEARIRLARLLGSERGQEHARVAYEIAEALDDPWLLSEAESALATLIRADDPGEAQRLLNRAVGRMVEDKNDRLLAYGWTERAAVTWETLPRDEAIGDALRVIHHLEALRERQTLGAGRADYFSGWIEVFHWLSGRLLESYSSSQRRADLDLAFEVAERMRARLLQDALQVSEAVPELADSDPRAQQRRELTGEIVAVNRSLLDPALGPVAQQALLADLDRLDRELATVDLEIAGDHPAANASTAFLPLATLETTLDSKTALLAFQVAPWQNIYGDFAGGSWVTVVTPEGTRVHPLAAVEQLEPQVRTFAGLFGTDHAEVEESAAAALYQGLLGDVLDDLPPEVERLIIVPDGPLYLVPFGALRSAVGEAPLVERFELAVVPSATLWAAWHQADRPTADAAVMVLADPRPAGQAGDLETARGWRSGALGPLPFARREGLTVMKRLGGDGKLLLGPDASERALKQADLGAFEVIHFAAHAVVDADRPHRSAVVLSPGADSEDGLLQPAEIAGLDLDGRIVVLAACEGAVGRLISGEGPLSLARPFFEAGASVVVASLWRLGDRAAAEFFDSFYLNLAQGESVGAAVRRAQLERIDASADAHDWAGLLVLGDGSVRLSRLPPERGGFQLDRLLPALVLALVGFGLALAWIWRSRRSGRR